VGARLALGSTQFGLPYGFGGQKPVSREMVAEILAGAWQDGIDLLDTAAVYGQAEELIGELRPAGARFSMVSKIAPIREARVGAAAIERMRAGVRESLRRLRVEALEAILVHHAPDLLVPGGAELFRALDELRQAGALRRIGVSVYDAATLRAVLASYPMQIVQLPINLLDQRLLRDGTLADLERRGVEVHARSVFLQGVLLAELGGLPTRFATVRDRLDRLRVQCASAGLSPAAAALGFVARCPGVARVIIGVESRAQLSDNVAAFHRAMNAAPVGDAAVLACEDPSIVDPRAWTS
jgi:aryl-alcohol dehydrogenase-like predicted oxidoreductase